mgnify:CR=1 FL=1
MARMYSRKKGKAGSTKPISKDNPVWVSYKPAEVEALIVKLAKQDMSSSKIGLVLRDSYGIPDVKVVLGKKIVQVLKEKKLAKKLPEDITFLIHKHIREMKHFDENKHDMVAKRGLGLTEAKIRRLAKYYKKNGVLPTDWKYDKTRAKLLVA